MRMFLDNTSVVNRYLPIQTPGVFILELLMHAGTGGLKKGIVTKHHKIDMDTRG